MLKLDFFSETPEGSCVFSLTELSYLQIFGTLHISILESEDIDSSIFRSPSDFHDAPTPNPILRTSLFPEKQTAINNTGGVKRRKTGHISRNKTL